MKKILLVSFSLFISIGGLAQTQEEIEANRLYKEAKTDMEAMKFNDALEKLEKAYQLFPIPQILVRIGECHEKLGNLEQALEIYKKLKQEKKIDPKLKGRIEKSISDIEFLLNSPVELTIAPNTTKVEVIVDHVDKYIAPCVIKITRGQHHFEFKKEGYETYKEEKMIQGPPSQTYVVNLVEQKGRVVFYTGGKSIEGVEIRVDDMHVPIVVSQGDRKKTEPVELKVGSHLLSCSKGGGIRYSTTFQVLPNQQVDVLCDITKKETPITKIIWWSTAGVGVVMTGVGIGLTVSYVQDKKKAEREDLKLTSNKQYFGPILISLGVAAMGTASYFIVKDIIGQKSHSSIEHSGFRLTLAPSKEGALVTGLVYF